MTKKKLTEGAKTGKDKRLENLIPISKRSKEDALKIQQKGGRARAKQIKDRRVLADCAKSLLNNRCPKNIKDKILKIFPEMKEDKNITAGYALIMKLFQKAIEGDLDAFTILRDTSGETPKIINEHTGKDGEPLNTGNNIIIDSSKVSLDDKKDFVNNYRAKNNES
jgi:hypothetical protein